MGYPRFGNKFGNKKTSHKGFSFASKAEAGLYDQLKLREMAGEIREIKVQDTVYMTRARIAYIVDFSFINCATGVKEYAEYKGFETAVWAIKKRLWKYYGAGILTIYYARSKQEVIITEACL